MHWYAATHSFAELCVHHEVVDMFLSLGQLQLPGYNCNHQCSATSTLFHEDMAKQTQRQFVCELSKCYFTMLIMIEKEPVNKRDSAAYILKTSFRNS